MIEDNEIVSIIETLTRKKKDNPFVGLRSYQADEGHWFFGRDEQVKELLQKLHTSHFLAIVGSSGCGKSSLIRAGVIPKLKGGFLTVERDKWLIAIMRPSGDPLLHLANAITEAVEKVDADAAKPVIELSKERILEIGGAGVVETIKGTLKNTRFNLLILVDQFEELFTYERSNADIKNENTRFVDLLLSLSEAKGLPVYSIITMRSDYFGQCNNFFGLPELINESQYLVPRLKWQQLREVIEYPIKLNGQKINPGLLDLLANEADRKSDELPVLQHCLMRTYQNWIKDGKVGVIEFKHYKGTGGLHGAILQHATETYNELNPAEKVITEYLFRCITEYNSDNEPVRRPKKFKVIREVCRAVEGATDSDILNVINTFRSNSCAFLTPEASKAITDETVIDISHESLMRQWNEIGYWMKKEQRNADKLYWLSECVTDKREYLRGIDVSSALAWQQSQRPNTEWAERYVDNLPDVLSYIQKSKRYSNRRKWIFIGIRALAVLGVIGGLVYYQHALEHDAEEEAKEQIIRIEAKAKSDADAQIKILAAKANADADASIKIKEAEAKANAYADLQIKIKAAEAKAEADAKAQISIRETKAKADAQKAIKEGLEQKNIELSRKNDEYTLTSEAFFRVNWIDNKSKSRLSNSLLQVKYDNNDTVEYKKILSALNMAASAERFKKEQPNIALTILKKAYDIFPHPVINASSLAFIRESQFYSNNTVFNKTQSVLKYNYYKRGLRFFSPLQQNYFLFNDVASGSIYMLKHNRGGIIMERVKVQNVDTIVSKTSDDSERPMQMIADGKNFSIVNQDKIHSFNALANEINRTNIPRSLKESYFVLAVSSQQNILAADDKYETISKTIRLFDPQTGRKKYDDIVITDSRGYFSKFVFSADGKRLMVFGDAGKLWLIDSLGKKPKIENLKFDDIHAANFTAEGKPFVWFKDSIELRDVNGIAPKKIYLPNSEAFNSRSMFLDDNWGITLSDNWKIILLSKGQQSYILQSKNDSIFKSITTNASITAVYEKIFLLDNLVYSFDDNEKTYTIKQIKWYNDTSFTDISSAYQYINVPVLSTFDSIRARLLDDTDLKLSGLSGSRRQELYNEVNELATTSLQKDELESAVKMYKALLLSENKLDDRKLVNFKNMIKRKFSLDSSYSDRHTDFKQVVELRQTFFNNSNKKVNDSFALATDYGAFSFYKLFVEDFNGAIEYSNKALHLVGDKAEEPLFNWLYTNLALGYLLNKQFAEADKIYVKYRDKLGTSFLQDFGELENAGILPRKEEDINSKIRNLREYLNMKKDRIE